MKIIMLFVFCCLLGIKFIIKIFYYVRDFIRRDFRIFSISKNLSAEYEASNVVRKSVINSSISCKLEINTELPKYNKRDEFFNAVLSGHIEQAKTILSTGYNINTMDKSGATALMHAVTLNKKDIIKFLIESGININAKDNFGRSAICYALLAQKTENIQYLLDNGADINMLDIYKNNLLIYALNISNNYAHPVNDIIRVLLSNNIKLNSLENIGISEIDYGIRQKIDVDVITQLYVYKYGNEVTFHIGRNSLSIYRNSLKILTIKFSILSDDEYISEFIEFNANGKKQVITHNNILGSKIVGSLIGIYNFQGQIFHGFGIDRSKKTVSELDDGTLLEFAKLDTEYSEDFPINTPPNKEKTQKWINRIFAMSNSFKYYILAFSNYFNFEGKATRPEFWFFYLYNFIIDIIILVFLYMGILNPYIISIYCMFVFIPKSAIMIRRLRDAGFHVYISVPYIIANLILMTTGLPSNKELYLLLRSCYWMYFIILIILLCFPSKEKVEKTSSQKIKSILTKYPFKYYIVALIVIILLILNSTGNTINSFISSDSSFISSAQYDPDERELLVNIHSNNGKSQYKYYNVDKRTFDEFKSSESKGTFFNQNIRNHYDYQRTKYHPRRRLK